MVNTNTKQWEKEQYETYASSFTNGDAILANGKWNSVYEENGFVWSNILHSEMHYPLPINEAQQNEVEGNYFIFDSECTDTPCEIVTLDKYMPRDGDKIVWLGDGILEFFTGEEHVIVFSTEDFRVKNGKVGLKSASPSFSVPYEHSEDILVDVNELPEKQLWGYIPSAKNTKELNNHSTVRERTEKCENKDDSSVLKAIELLIEWHGEDIVQQLLIEDLANIVSTAVLHDKHQLAQEGLDLINELKRGVK